MDFYKNTESQVLLCDCHSDEHQILVHFDDEDREVYLHIHLASRGFWARLMYALKYVFGYKSRYGAWDSFIFRRQDAIKIYDIAKYLESPKRGWYPSRSEFDKLSDWWGAMRKEGLIHPFTCDCSGGDKCERKNGTGEGEMEARDGWFQCPCGAFKQHKL